MEEGFAVEIPDLTGGFAALLGLTFEEATADRVVIRWQVRPELHQPFGLLHGGVYCSVVETAASVGGAFWLGDRGRVVGVSNQTDFLRAVRDGELTAVGTPVHRGRSQQLWQVEITDDAQRLVARGQVRLQNLTRD
ncbi:PaaI family thioesterase [Micromonospora sp. WMMD1120]|uniref:PaaI family thioesterase n=1 Tax=Micromonospora sp. WMMD1120 TaxID=3016106 RepID=UPI0024166646|nr:PaaI family thioesterase [Micromonospora sp. WMMD1120]MDG4809295.1 PaaI family thioesterase [Micromonospora sp. WMMD1120]